MKHDPVPSLQEQVIHGGASPCRVLAREKMRVELDPPWKLIRSKPRKERRFEQFVIGSSADPPLHGLCKPGKGNPYRRVSQQATRECDEVWDHRFQYEEIPHYSPMTDPHCTILTYPWTTVHQGVARQQRRRRPPLDCDLELWNDQLLTSTYRDSLNKEREAMPWPEVHPETSTSGGYRWRSYNMDDFNNEKRLGHFKGYNGCSAQGNSDMYSGDAPLLQTTLLPYDETYFEKAWHRHKYRKKGFQSSVSPTHRRKSQHKARTPECRTQRVHEPIQIRGPPSGGSPTNIKHSMGL